MYLRQRLIAAHVQCRYIHVCTCTCHEPLPELARCLAPACTANKLAASCCMLCATTSVIVCCSPVPDTMTLHHQTGIAGCNVTSPDFQVIRRRCVLSPYVFLVISVWEWKVGHQHILTGCASAYSTYVVHVLSNAVCWYRTHDVKAIIASA